MWVVCAATVWCMAERALVEVTSHIGGKNARVRVFPDRVEWERPKSVSGAKMTAAVLTVGMSAAVTGGVKSRRGAGTEVIPMRAITSVTTRRDTVVNDVVSIITAGNTIDLRCSRKDAERLKQVILDGVTGRYAPAPAAAVAPVPAPPAPPAPPVVALPPAGWFPDPDGSGNLRWWDGTTWTDHRVPQG